MTPPRGAMEILTERTRLEFVIETLAERAYGHSELPPAEAELLRQRVRERAIDLLDEWARWRRTTKTTAWACSTIPPRPAPRSSCSTIS